jgi:DNA/RNA-binding domain of Phe-tRNA-synthetase-like protein
MNHLGFNYHPDVLERFPYICGGVILVQDLVNKPSPPGLLDAYTAEQQRIIEAIGEKPLSEIPSLSAWRSAFRQFGVDPTRYRSAAEALLRRLTKKGDIPSINSLVDLCNLVSIRYALPVAAFDTRHLSGPITVQFAVGNENFTAHDSPEPEHPEPGEVIFADPNGLVVARRWCWKQSVESTIAPDTTAAIITIEAQHPNSKMEIKSALNQLEDLLDEYTGGNFTSKLVGNPS